MGHHMRACVAAHRHQHQHPLSVSGSVVDLRICVSVVDLRAPAPEPSQVLTAHETEYERRSMRERGSARYMYMYAIAHCHAMGTCIPTCTRACPRASSGPGAAQVSTRRPSLEARERASARRVVEAEFEVTRGDRKAETLHASKTHARARPPDKKERKGRAEGAAPSLAPRESSTLQRPSACTPAPSKPPHSQLAAECTRRHSRAPMYIL
ncbi:hypothetical protein B0H13DRAFT_1983733 [Mycena leptocephala]|nr:hypothetical protein B0H13DRAFT_1983733 [Mycena leptocephala]